MQACESCTRASTGHTVGVNSRKRPDFKRVCIEIHTLAAVSLPLRSAAAELDPFKSGRALVALLASTTSSLDTSLTSPPTPLAYRNIYHAVTTQLYSSPRAANTSHRAIAFSSLSPPRHHPCQQQRGVQPSPSGHRISRTTPTSTSSSSSSDRHDGTQDDGIVLQTTAADKLRPVQLDTGEGTVRNGYAGREFGELLYSGRTVRLVLLVCFGARKRVVASWTRDRRCSRLFFDLRRFLSQDEPAYCGLGTLCMVLNALEIDPQRTWKGAWRWYSQEVSF